MTLPLSSIGCGLLLAAYFLWQDKGEAVQELKEGGLSNPIPTTVVGVAGHSRAEGTGNTLYCRHSFIQ